jgi:hypothetical protein
MSNRIRIEIPTSKTDNCRAKGRFLVEYCYRKGLRRIPVFWKRLNHEVTLEYSSNKIAIYTVPAMAFPCFETLEDDGKVCVVETLEAENAIIETLLHELGTRIASKLKFADRFTYKMKFQFVEELYNHDGRILTPRFRVRGEVHV